MDSAEEKDAHKRAGTSCIKASPGNLFESTRDKVTAYSDGQYSSPDLLSKNGRHKKFTNELSFQTDLGTAIKEKSNCDSRIPSQCTEKACRHRISLHDRFFRLEASPLGVPKTFCDLFRPLCCQGVSPASNICSLEERTMQYGNKCILNNLEEGVLLCISSFLSNNTGSEQDKEGKDKKLILITPCWQKQLWYSQVLSMLIRKPVILPLSEKLLSNPSGQTHPLVTNQTPTLVAWIVSGDSCFRKDFLLRQSILSPIQGDRVLYQVTIRPGSDLAGMIKGQSIHFDVL